MPASPPIVTLDTIENASLDVGEGGGLNFKRQIRPCFVEGIDVSDTGNKSEALWLAQEAIIAAVTASGLEATRADMIVTRIFLEPAGDTQARGRIVYELPQFGGGPPSTYLLTDDALPRTIETNMVPGSREPLMCTWTDTAGGSGGSPNSISDRITYRIMAPLRTITVDALIYGRPMNGQTSITYVNSAEWPTGAITDMAPHDRAFWRLDRYRTAYARYAGYFQLTAQATTKLVEDWSEFGTLKNAQTGRFVKVDPVEIAALLGEDYTFGYLNGNGIQRFGPYPLVDFQAIFGF